MQSSRIYSYDDLLKSPHIFRRMRRALFWSGLIAAVGLVVSLWAPFPVNAVAPYVFGLALFSLMRVTNVVSDNATMWLLFFVVPGVGVAFPVCAEHHVSDYHGMVFAIGLVAYFVIGLFAGLFLDESMHRRSPAAFRKARKEWPKDPVDRAAASLMRLLGVLVTPDGADSRGLSRLLKRLGVDLVSRTILAHTVPSMDEFEEMVSEENWLNTYVEDILAGAEAVGLSDARERLFLFFVSIMQEHSAAMGGFGETQLDFLEMLGETLGLAKEYVAPRLEVLRQSMVMPVLEAARILGVDILDLTEQAVEEAFHQAMTQGAPDSEQANAVLAARARPLAWLKGKR